jgi:uncharacterized protein YukE
VAGGLTVPGDPDALEQLSTRLRYAAQGVGSLGGNTRQFTTGTLAGAGWTGSAADSFSAFGTSLGEGAGAASAPLTRIASAVETYASSLRTAQQRAAELNSIADTASTDPSSAVMQAVRQAGERAAAEVTSASGQLQDLFSTGPVRNFIATLPAADQDLPVGGWMPGDPVPDGLGTEILGNPGAFDLGSGTEVLPPAPDIGLPEGDPLPPELGLPEGDPLPSGLWTQILTNPGSGQQGPLVNYNTPGDSGDDPPDGDGTDPDEGVVAPRDVHGQLRAGSRGIDEDYVREHGELYYQDDGQLVRILDNGNGTSSVVVYDPANPTKESTTAMLFTESQIQSRFKSGKWFD